MFTLRCYMFIAVIFLFLSNFCFAQRPRPKVSIITSVFNGDEFIDGFMEDITRQTIFGQCELIMINAASSGIKEEDIIFEYMKKFPNIIYVKLATDPGLYAVWNLGIKLSRGAYITNANIDDRLEIHSLEQHARALDDHADIGIVYSDFYISHVANETFEQTNSQEIFTLPEGDKNFLCKGGNHPMWRKTLHKTCGLFNEDYKGLGDWDMWIRFTLKGTKFMKLPGLTGVWYHNPKGLSTDPDHGFIATEYKDILQKYRSFFAHRLKSAKDL